MVKIENKYELTSFPMSIYLDIGQETDYNLDEIYNELTTKYECYSIYLRVTEYNTDSFTVLKWIVPRLINNGYHVSVEVNDSNFFLLKGAVNPNSSIISFKLTDKFIKYFDTLFCTVNTNLIDYNDTLWIKSCDDELNIKKLRNILLEKNIRSKVVYTKNMNIKNYLLTNGIYDLIEIK